MAAKTSRAPGKQRTIDLTLEGRAIPKDGVSVRGARIEERIGAPFAIDVTFVSHEPLDPVEVVGSPVRVATHVDGHVQVERRMHGLVESLQSRVDLDVDHGIYEARVVPALSLLGMTRTQEVYIDTSLPELIRRKLGALGMKERRDFELRLGRTYEKREFIVQMDETDLSLILRLAEHLGVSLFFEHARGRSMAVFTDDAPGFTKLDAPIHFDPHAEHVGIRTLVQRMRAVPALVAVSDYNYTLPELDLLSIVNVEGGLVGGLVEYGAAHMTPDQGAALARLRAEELMSGQEVFEGVANAHELTSGHVIRFEGHPRLADAAFLVTSAVHRLGPEGHDAHRGTTLEGDASFGDTNGAPLTYSCRFEAISAERSFRPARVTPRPRITGLLSGIIEAPPGIDPQGGQAFIDDRGRYLVRMLFDSARPGERKASLRVRMLQAHAGPNYGIHFPLRPGAEVMLGFEHGDPDRPVIVGSAPNALTPTPVTETSSTLHRIRTWSGVQVEIDDGG